MCGVAQLFAHEWRGAAVCTWVAWHSCLHMCGVVQLFAHVWCGTGWQHFGIGAIAYTWWWTAPWHDVCIIKWDSAAEWMMEGWSRLWDTSLAYGRCLKSKCPNASPPPLHYIQLKAKADQAPPHLSNDHHLLFPSLKSVLGLEYLGWSF